LGLIDILTFLESGDSLEEFLEDFPTVSREQAVALLEEAGEFKSCGWMTRKKRKPQMNTDEHRFSEKSLSTSG
jgi:hypothetical protein